MSAGPSENGPKRVSDILTLSDNLSQKERQLREILGELQHYLDQIGELAQRIESVRKDLTQINPFDERLYQTEKALGAVKEAAENCSVQREDLRRRINEKYLPVQKFVPVDLKEGLELLDRSLTAIGTTMEDYQGAYKKAKTIRTDYFTVYDRIKTWIENAELTISNHGIDPSELKSKLIVLINEFGDMRLAHEQLLFNGNEIMRHCTESSDRTATKANMDQLTHELDKTIALIEQKNQTVDQILGNWANFMRLYQSVVDWSIKIRALLERKLQLNTLHEAQLACQNYSNAVNSLADVSQNLSEMNHEFDKINEVCSTAYLKGKLHEAETLKIDIETVLFERNLFLHETTEEWQQYERKIESVKEWIKDSYQALNSSELKSKPLRDQLRILEQMLADISAQKIKVNMSLEKLQVHFHSDIIYTDNPNIVQCGRAVMNDLDKLNLDVFQTTQNLDQALSQIEGCQAEMQTIRQRIVHEEQQLRNILSPLHQSSDSEKHEQDRSMPYDWSVECYDQEPSAPSTTEVRDAKGHTDTRSVPEVPIARSQTGRSVVVVTGSTQPAPSAWSRTGDGDDLTYAEIVAGLRRQRQRGYDPPLHVIERHTGQQNVTNIAITSPVQHNVRNVSDTFASMTSTVPASVNSRNIDDQHQAARTVVQLTGDNKQSVDEPIARDPPKEQRRSRRPPSTSSKLSIRPADTVDSMAIPSIVNVTTIVGATSTQPVVVMTAAKGPEITQPEVSSVGSAGPTSVWSFGNKTYAEVLKEIAASNQYRIQQQQLQQQKQQEYLQPSWSESSYHQHSAAGKQQIGASVHLGLPQSYANRSRSSSRNRPKPEAVSRVNIVHSDYQRTTPSSQVQQTARPVKVQSRSASVKSNASSTQSQGAGVGEKMTKKQAAQQSVTDRKSERAEAAANVNASDYVPSEQSDPTENVNYRKAKKSKIKPMQSKDDKLLPVSQEPRMKANEEQQQQVFVTEINVNKSDLPARQSTSPMKTVSIVNLTDQPEVVASAETKITINVNEPVQVIAETTEVEPQKEHYVTQIRLDQEAGQRRQQIRKSAKKRNKTTTTHKLLDISMSEPVMVQEQGKNISTVEIVSPKEKNVSVVDLRPLEESLTVTSIELKGEAKESLETYSKQIELQLDAGNLIENSKKVDESMVTSTDLVQAPIMFTEEIVNISQPRVTDVVRCEEEETVQETETVTYHRSEVLFTTVTETVQEEIKVINHQCSTKDSSAKTFTTSLHIEQTNLEETNAENVVSSTEILELKESNKPDIQQVVENVAKGTEIWCPPTKKKGKKKQSKKTHRTNDDHQDDSASSRQVTGIELKRAEFVRSMLTEATDQTDVNASETELIPAYSSDIANAQVKPSAEEVALMSAREESFLAEMSGPISEGLSTEENVAKNAREEMSSADMCDGSVVNVEMIAACDVKDPPIQSQLSFEEIALMNAREEAFLAEMSIPVVREEMDVVPQVEEPTAHTEPSLEELELIKAREESFSSDMTGPVVKPEIERSQVKEPSIRIDLSSTEITLMNAREESFLAEMSSSPSNLPNSLAERSGPASAQGLGVMLEMKSDSTSLSPSAEELALMNAREEAFLAEMSAQVSNVEMITDSKSEDMSASAVPSTEEIALMSAREEAFLVEMSSSNADLEGQSTTPDLNSLAPSAEEIALMTAREESFLADASKATDLPSDNVECVMENAEPSTSISSPVDASPAPLTEAQSSTKETVVTDTGDESVSTSPSTKHTETLNLATGKSPKKKQKDKFKKIKKSDAANMAAFLEAERKVFEAEEAAQNQPALPEPRARDQTSPGMSSITKEQIETIIVGINFERQKSLTSANNSETNVAEANLTSTEDTFVVNMPESPVKSAREFRSNLVFEDYDFMHQSPVKGSHETDRIDGKGGRSKEDKFKPHLESIPWDADLLGKGESHEKSTIRTESTVSSTAIGKSTTTESKDSDKKENMDIDSGKENNDPVQRIVINSKWRDNRQKISMITHEEVLLHPVSHIKMQLPKIIAAKVEQVPEVKPDVVPLEPIVQETPKEEFVGVDDELVHQDIQVGQVATEVSMLDISPSIVYETQSVDVLEKEAVLPDVTDMASGMVVATEAKQSDMLSDTVTFAEQQSSSQEVYTTTTTSVMYRTTTITYMQSDEQEEINEIYTSPTVVEQSVKTAIITDEPTLDVSVSYSEADRSMGDELMVERIVIAKDEDVAGTVDEAVISEVEPDESVLQLNQSLLDSSVISEADRSVGEEVIETKTMIVSEESEGDEERVVREMCKESFQQDASFEMAKQTASPVATTSAIELPLGSPLEPESSYGQDYWQYHDTERHYIQNFEVQSSNTEQEDVIVDNTTKESSPAKEIMESTVEQSNVEDISLDTKDASMLSNKSERELAEIYRTLQLSYLSMWQLRDAENNYQLLDAREANINQIEETLNEPTVISDIPVEIKGIEKTVLDEQTEQESILSSQLEVLKSLGRSFVNNWQLKEAEMSYAKLKSWDIMLDSKTKFDVPTEESKELVSSVALGNNLIEPQQDLSSEQIIAIEVATMDVNKEIKEQNKATVAPAKSQNVNDAIDQNSMERSREEALKHALYYTSIGFHDTLLLRDAEKKYVLQRQVHATEAKIDDPVSPLDAEERELLHLSAMSKTESLEPVVSETTAEEPVVCETPLEEVPCPDSEEQELLRLSAMSKAETVDPIVPETTAEDPIVCDTPLEEVPCPDSEEQELLRLSAMSKAETLEPVVSETTDTPLEEVPCPDSEEQELLRLSAMSKAETLEPVVPETTAEEEKVCNTSQEEVPCPDREEQELLKLSAMSKAESLEAVVSETTTVQTIVCETPLEEVPCPDSEEQELLRLSAMSKAETLEPVVPETTNTPLDEVPCVDMEEHELSKLSAISRAEDLGSITKNQEQEAIAGVTTVEVVEQIESSMQPENIQQFVIELSVAESKESFLHEDVGDESISSVDLSKSSAFDSSMASMVSKPEISFINLPLEKNVAAEDIELMVSSIESNEGVIDTAVLPDQSAGEIVVEGKLLVQVNIPQKNTEEQHTPERKEKRKKEKKQAKKAKQLLHDAGPSKEGSATNVTALDIAIPKTEAPIPNVWEQMKGKKTYAEVVAGKEAERRRLLELQMMQTQSTNVPLGDEVKLPSQGVGLTDKAMSRNESFVEVELSSETDLQTFIDSNKSYEKMEKSSTSWADVVHNDVVDNSVPSHVVPADVLPGKPELTEIVESLKQTVLDVQPTEQDSPKSSAKRESKQKKKQKKRVSDQIASPAEDVSLSSGLHKPDTIVPLSESPKEIAHLHEHVHDDVQSIADDPTPSGLEHEKHVKFSVEVEILKEIPLSESPKEIEHLREHHAHKPCPMVEEEVAPTVHTDDANKHVKFVDEILVLPPVPLSESAKELDALTCTTSNIETGLAQQAETIDNEAEDLSSEKKVKFDHQVEILPTVPFSESNKEIERDICFVQDDETISPDLEARVTNSMKIEVVELVGSPYPDDVEDDKRVKFDPMVEVLHNVPFSESVKETSSIGTEKQTQYQAEEELPLIGSADDPPQAERRVSFSETVVKIELKPDDDDDGFEVIDMAEVEELDVCPELSEIQEKEVSQDQTQEDSTDAVSALPKETEKKVSKKQKNSKKKSNAKEVTINSASQDESELNSTPIVSDVDVASQLPRAGLLYADVVAQKSGKGEHTTLKAQITDYDTETVVREDYLVVQEISITEAHSSQEPEVAQSVQAEFSLKSEPSVYDSAEIRDVCVEENIVLSKVHEQLSNEDLANQVAIQDGTIEKHKGENDVTTSDLQFVLPPIKMVDDSAVENNQLRDVPLEKIPVDNAKVEQPPDNADGPLSIEGLYCIWQDRSWLDRSFYRQAEERYAMANVHNAISDDQQHIEEHDVPSNASIASDVYTPPTATALAQSVESILDSLISAELEMNNLSYDNVNDLIKGLQVLLTNLAEYKQQNYAIARSLPVNADSHVQAAVQQIDERIDLLRQRAENGLEKIQQTLKQREHRKEEVRNYLQLLEEIERWLSSTSIHLMEMTECSTEEEMRRRKDEECAVLNDLREKEQFLKDVLEKTSSYLEYKDVAERTTTLRENLTLLIRILREKALILENNIQRLTDHLHPAEPAIQPKTVDIESQTSPLASIEPVPVSLDIVQSEMQLPVGVVTQESSVQTQSAPEQHTTDNILIIQSVVNGRETVQISNVPRSLGLADQPLEESVVVEARYTQPAEGSECDRSSELLVKNIPTQFETTFTEPDDTTTEIVVNRDGSKRITLRKVVQPAQSIESTMPGRASIVTSVDLAVQQSEPQAAITGDERIVVDVEGVDVVLDESTKQKQDEAIEASSPLLSSESPIQEAAQTVVAEVLDEVKQMIQTAEQAAEQQPEEPSQVFDSHAQIAPVELIASIVESQTSTSTLLGADAEFVAAPCSDAVAIDSLSLNEPLTASGELNVPTDKPVESIEDIWPPSEYVCNVSAPERSLPLSPVHSDVREIIEEPANTQQSEEAQQIWPTSPERGSDYIQIEPNVLKSPVEDAEVEKPVSIVLEDQTLEYVAVDRDQEIEVPIMIEEESSVMNVPLASEMSVEIIPPHEHISSISLPVAPEVIATTTEIADESMQTESVKKADVPTLASEPTLEVIESSTLRSEPHVETTITRTTDTIEDADSCTTIVETVLITKTTTTEEIIEIPVEVECDEPVAEDEQDETVMIEKVTHVTTIVERVVVEDEQNPEEVEGGATIEETVSEPTTDTMLVKQEPVLTSIEDGNNLQVQVASIGESQTSSLKVSMTVDPSETKKISVSLIEVKSTEVAAIDDAKQTAASEPVELEEISGLKAVEVDPGYEADKTATAEGEPEEDDKGKKKRKKKKKGKLENEKASNTDQLPDPKSNVVKPADTDGRLSEAQQSEQRFDSYQSFTEEDQPQTSTVNVMEEAVEPEFVDIPINIQEKIVVPTEVLEAIYTEDVQQQTTPSEFASGQEVHDATDVEIEKITSERLMVPIDWEQRSMQTSPEPEIQRTSRQTSPLIVEQEGTVTEQETKEIQTTAVEAIEIETQTLQPLAQVQQEAQTDPSTESTVGVREVDTVDTANQTVPIETKETQQQAENTEEIVGPILGQLVKDVIDPTTLYRRQSVQTSPVNFAADVDAPESNVNIEKADDSAQTNLPDVQDANVETDTVLVEDRGISPPAELSVEGENKPSSSQAVLTTESAMQTSPMHDAGLAELEYSPKYEIQDEILIQTITQNVPTVESVDMQTVQVPTVESDSQTTPVAVTEITETVTISTQTKQEQSPEKVEVEEKPAPSSNESTKRSKTKKSKKSKDKSIPIEVEVSTQMIVPSMSASGVPMPGSSGSESVTVTKTIIADGKGPDGQEDVSLNIQVNIDPSFGTIEEQATSSSFNEKPPATVSCPINESSIDGLQSQNLQLSLSDCFSIMKSQQNYAEQRVIPWQDINQMFVHMKLPSLSPAAVDTVQRSNDYPILSTSHLFDEEDDTICANDDLDHVLQLLEKNNNDPIAQQHVLFDVVENAVKSLEDLDAGITVAQANAEDGVLPVDRAKLLRVYKIRLIRIEEHIVKIITYVQRTKIGQNKEVDDCLNNLVHQVKALQRTAANEEAKLSMDATKWRMIGDQIRNAGKDVETAESTLNDLVANDTMPISSKLGVLQEQQTYCQQLMRTMKQFYDPEIKFEEKIANELDQVMHQLRRLENGLVLESNKLVQLCSLAEEYEQTLFEFQETTATAEVFIENEIVTNSLEELQEEMQRYRKFFVNLNHCKAMLESLETNLDPLTRQKYAELHTSLYNRTKVILERAVDRAGKLALAASRWTVLEKEMVAEKQWLQVAQQRVPDLSNVSSQDFERYITMYESLEQDIANHLTKMRSHHEMARHMHDLISAPILERESNEALLVAMQLQEEVLLYLNLVTKFKAQWNRYNTHADRLVDWLDVSQGKLANITIEKNLSETPVDDMRTFWEIKAQFEVLNNKVYKTAYDTFDQALRTIAVTDEQLQRQLHSQLLDDWSVVSNRIDDIQRAIAESMKTKGTPPGDKLAFIEQELQEIAREFDSSKAVLKSQEDLYAYIERIQTLKTRIQLIDTELVRQFALDLDCNTEKASAVSKTSRHLSQQISEELDAAELFYHRLEDIELGIKSQEARLTSIAHVLDECSGSVNGKRSAIEKALADCKSSQDALGPCWSELMRLRQMLHTLPMNLKVSVSPLQTERDLSTLQNVHSDLERRSEEVMTLLRNRLALWNKFHKQLDLIQEHVQETEFMMELLQLQESADYNRLLKATERLDTLLADIDDRKGMIEDLHTYAQPLVESSDESVSAEIQETVQQISVVWESTRENLRELCERYEKAVKLWQHYHDVCETVKDWVNHEYTDYDELHRLEDLPQVEVYQQALLDQRQEVEKLRKLIGDINEQVGFNVGDTLLAEIDECSKKLEDIERNVEDQRSRVREREKARVNKANVVQTSRGLLDRIQESLQHAAPSQRTADENLCNKIVDLRSYMLSLCVTIARLKDIQRDREQADDNGNLQNFHSVSQNLLQDTFQQYQELVQQLVTQSEDDERLLDFWQEYLQFVMAFLSEPIPSDYAQLKAHREQCLLIKMLLISLRKVLLQKSKIDVRLVERFNVLSEQHSDRIDRYLERITEIDNRLWHWEKFRSLGDNLYASLSDIERDKFTLQLEYINLPELPKLIAKVNGLLEQFPRLEEDLSTMNQELAQLTLYTKDECTLVGMRSEQGKIAEKVSKLQDNVETWKNFLFSIDETHGRFTKQSHEIETHLHELEQYLNQLDADQCNTNDLGIETRFSGVQARLNLIKNHHVRLDTVRTNLEEIGQLHEELKACISMFDVQRLHKRVWTLWQIFGKLEQRVVILVKHTEARSRKRKLFQEHYQLLMEWMRGYELKVRDPAKYESCTDDQTFIQSVEDTMRQELTLKQWEKDWLMTVGRDLLQHCTGPEEYEDITNHLETLEKDWSYLCSMCDSRTETSSTVQMRMRSLETRIAEIKAWMMNIERELTMPFVVDSLEQTTLDRLLDDYEKLQRSIESNSGNVAEVLNLCEIVAIDVQSYSVNINIRSIQNDANDVDMRWKKLCRISGSRKRDLMDLWNTLLSLQNGLQFQQWVYEQHEYIRRLEQSMTTFDGEQMAEELESIAIRMHELETREECRVCLRKQYISLVLNDLVSSEGIRFITTPVHQMLLIWDRLQPDLGELRNDLERCRSDVGKFVVKYEQIILALTQIDVQVTQIEHLPAESTDEGPVPAETHIQRLRDLHSELLLVVDLFEKEDSLGANLIAQHAANQTLIMDIRQKMDEYHQLGNGLKERLDALLVRATEVFEKDVAVQVNTLRLERSESITAKDAYRYQLETALTEAVTNLGKFEEAIAAINANNFVNTTQNVSKASAACESSIELVKHLNTLLISECHATTEEAFSTRVREETERYHRFLAEWKQKQEQLEESSNADYLTCPLCTNRNWQQIDNDLWRLEQWLAMAESTQRNQLSSPPSDIDALEDTIQDHREFLLDLDSHKSIIKSLNIVGEHLATHTRDTARAAKLRERLQKNNRRWDTVCTGASRWQSALNSALMENREFHRTIAELSGWLEQTENKIKSSEPIDLTSDQRLVEKKYRMFRELRADLMRCEPRVVSLQETTSQLTKYVDANKSEKFDEVYAKLTDLRLRFHSIRRLVEMYIIKIGASLGYDSSTSLADVPSSSSTTSLSTVDRQQARRRQASDLQESHQRDGSGSRNHPSQATAHDSSTNLGTGTTEGDDDVINTTILTRSYRFLGRVIRASLPIQAMLLLLLGVVTLMPHGEEYSCSLANNFARSLEPMLRYPNGPPPI
uniref:KASH domain-containing protein n=1 Tax=Anopheles culicifacies TaxID=139723 RepID=A0A182LS31_9DIPT